MKTISIVIPCHSINTINKFVSYAYNQKSDNLEFVIAYDKNEIDYGLLTNHITDKNTKLIPCSPISGKYEPFMSDTEICLAAINDVQGDYIIISSENVQYQQKFIETVLKKVSAEEPDVCITPLAVYWPDNNVTVYDANVIESDPKYYFATDKINSLFISAASCWWLHSSENRIIKKDFLKRCTDKLAKFYFRHNAHLDLDSIVLFAELMSRSPKISFEKNTYATLFWKNQDQQISNFFDNVNNDMFITETEQTVKHINEQMRGLFKNDENSIQTFNENFLSRIVWRYEWKFKDIRQKLEKIFNIELSKFTLDKIGNHGTQLANNEVNFDDDSSEIGADAFDREHNDTEIAIYVSMHKMAYIPESNKYIIPIQVGAALSDERFSKMIHDDDAPDNISEKNKMYCEMTSQYYVWKNIKDKDYYGFWHYRRYFSFNENERDDQWGTVYHQILNEESLHASNIDEDHLLNACKMAEIIVPRKWHCVEDGQEMTIYDHWCKHFNKFDMDTTLKIILKKYPEYYSSAMEVLHSNYAIFCNMFIMDRKHFEEYSKFCFDVLYEVEQVINQDTYNIEEYRTLGHIGERLLAIYVTYIETNNPEVRVKYVGRVQYGDVRPVGAVDYPVFYSKKAEDILSEVDVTEVKAGRCQFIKNETVNHDNCISVMLACNDVYMVYTNVLLQSIKENINKNFYYDIVICHRDISEYNQKVAATIFNDNPNVLLRFVDVSKNFDKYKNVHIDRHLTYETYYRFLVLDIFKDYERVLYLDCDMVVNSDISKLFFTPMRDDEYIAAVRDYDFIANCIVNSEFYKEKILRHIRIDSYFNYFQAGMILFNLTSLRNNSFTTDGLFETALSRNWYFHDQDVLNCLFNGHIKYVNDKWNVFTLLENKSAREKLILKDLPAKYAESYKISATEPRIVHYAGVPKVWDDSSVHLADIFWRYARQSPFYESLLNNLHNGKGAKEGWILFTKEPQNQSTTHFFTIETIKEIYSSDYCVIDFIYLSNHTNIITDTLIINLSLFPHKDKKFWLDVKEFRWAGDNQFFKDKIFYNIDDFNLNICINQMEIYTGFSFKIREMQSRSISKPTIRIINSGFIR